MSELSTSSLSWLSIYNCVLHTIAYFDALPLYSEQMPFYSIFQVVTAKQLELLFNSPFVFCPDWRYIYSVFVSSYDYRLIKMKFCRWITYILKLWVWHYGCRKLYFTEIITCWTWSCFQPYSKTRHLFCVINSPHTWQWITLKLCSYYTHTEDK